MIGAIAQGLLQLILSEIKSLEEISYLPPNKIQKTTFWKNCCTGHWAYVGP